MCAFVYTRCGAAFFALWVKKKKKKERNWGVCLPRTLFVCAGEKELNILFKKKNVNIGRRLQEMCVCVFVEGGGAGVPLHACTDAHKHAHVSLFQHTTTGLERLPKIHSLWTLVSEAVCGGSGGR